MYYVSKGIVTPEMEFVALRESMRMEELRSNPRYAAMLREPPGRDFGAKLPKQITPDFVRDEVTACRAIIPRQNQSPGA